MAQPVAVERPKIDFRRSAAQPQHRYFVSIRNSQF
jgi:hypothetical protein